MIPSRQAKDTFVEFKGFKNVFFIIHARGVDVNKSTVTMHSYS